MKTKSLENVIEHIKYVEALIQVRDFLEDTSSRLGGDAEKKIIERVKALNEKIEAFKKRA